MRSLSCKPALVVGVKQSRRIEVSDKLRAMGAVVVEAMTVPQADAAMRQLRFEFIFVDLLSIGVGVLDFLDNVQAQDPESCVFVVGPTVDFHLFGKLQSPDLAKLGFDSTPDAIGKVLPAMRVGADNREHLGGRRSATATTGSTKPNGRQESTIIFGRHAMRRASN